MTFRHFMEVVFLFGKFDFYRGKKTRELGEKPTG